MSNRRRRTAIGTLALALGLGLSGGAPAVAGPSPFGDLAAGHGGVLDEILGGDGGLLGPLGLFGSGGGVAPRFLGGHDGADEFSDGMGDLFDALSGLPGELHGAPPIGGDDVGEDLRIGGGVLESLLGVESLVDGLTGRF